MRICPKVAKIWKIGDLHFIFFFVKVFLRATKVMGLPPRILKEIEVVTNDKKRFFNCSIDRDNYFIDHFLDN